MASRRRRRKTIGKVLTSVERKVRRAEKRPGPKRLKTNVVTTEKILPRAIVTKKIADDAVTANEAAFGVNVVSDTDPDIVKDGTTVTDPDTGSTKVYSEDLSAFVTVTDETAVTAANDAYDLADTKNTVYRQNNAPTGGTYKTNDIWIDTDDNNQLYVWNGTTWVTARDGNIATAQSAANAAQSTANGKNTVYYSTSAPGSTPNTAGDIWFQYSSGIIVAQFSGAGGTSWTSTTIGNAVIANLDAGKITTGILNVAGTVKISTNTSGSRIELNPTGFYAYNGSTPTVQILSADGSASFTGTINASTITGSTFTSTNYPSGTGLAIAVAGSGGSILFNSSGVQKGNITVVSTGMQIVGGSSDILLTDSTILIDSPGINLQIDSTARLSSTGGDTSGTNGILRNTYASSGAPSGGSDGDVWLRWA